MIMCTLQMQSIFGSIQKEQTGPETTEEPQGAWRCSCPEGAPISAGQRMFLNTCDVLGPGLGHRKQHPEGSIRAALSPEGP